MDDEMRQEVEVGSSEEEWAHVTSDRCRFDRGCNQELMWTRGGGVIPAWIKDMTPHLQQRAVRPPDFHACSL